MREKMKLDYNNLTRLIMEAVSGDLENEKMPYVAFSIEIGLEVLSSYLKDIATLAIKRNDAELLELCKGLLIVKEGNDETDI